jgi:pyrroline-5-carboxylate reductase
MLTLMMSPTLAYRRLEPPSTLMHITDLAPVLSATSSRDCVWIIWIKSQLESPLPPWLEAISLGPVDKAGALHGVENSTQNRRSRSLSHNSQRFTNFLTRLLFHCGDPAAGFNDHLGCFYMHAMASSSTDVSQIAFVGGGNMASAIMGGLVRHTGTSPAHIHVVEPWAEQRQRLAEQWHIHAAATADAAGLEHCNLVVWAVKPQNFAEAAAMARPYLHPHALHLSVAAGIRSNTIAEWLGSERIVRAMPNTPALVGLGMTGLFARPTVSADERQRIHDVLTPTGQSLWIDAEEQLDAVTALSGSGPAYVFYFLEAMTEAGGALGLTREQAHQLAVGTFVGASTLARDSHESPAVLRQRVTSKGGTTHAALSHMDTAGTYPQFVAAIQAAAHRATELGDEFSSK